ncbi:putative DNA repair protein rhp7 [Glarea lozoyensis 74030]|uniref:Putative DNA repair protein rhp7 n=1 Tax=Glarea lozoyensis (strain ATCC 74030 / MF5533) TaxID=1104152 RepID=H0ENW1_GLAL7|nr:putative DNA repair protein rhp7 [Glarea lozoyensis 74030]
MNPPNPPNAPNGGAQRPVRQIRGPQSALTDFLASHNINANQIRQDADARRAAALASRQAGDDDENTAPTPPSEDEPVTIARKRESKAQTAKRKKEEETCPDLKILKVSHNQKVTDAGIAHLANLNKLEKLTLQIYKPTTSKPYVKVIDAIGSSLRTLCLDAVHTINDKVLESIHNNCHNLTKLRITDNEVLTDAAFATLFTNWSNPPLTNINLSKCRHIDAADPRDNPSSIGLGSAGFVALMVHSSKTLRYLDIHSCRHISLETFESVFNPTEKTYPELKKMNLSFCSNDEISKVPQFNSQSHSLNTSN